MTYNLRMPAAHGLTQRVLRSHRYRITPTGAQRACSLRASLRGRSPRHVVGR